MMVQAQDDTIRSLEMTDGARLAYRHWRVRGAKGAVVCVHGIQSHSGWYGASGTHMAQAGYEVVFPDRRGSGLNRHARGDATDWHVLADDLSAFVADVRRRLGDVPVHVSAISWGAKLACATLILHPDLARSLILVGPGLVSKIDVCASVKLHTALALVANPRRRFDIPLGDARLFTDNPGRVAYIGSDALSLRTCTARFLWQTRRLDRFVWMHASELRTPLLVMLGGRDRIVDAAGTRALVDRFASTTKEFIEYPDAAHTLEFEPDPTRFFDDMVTWLDAQTGVPPAPPTP